MPSNLSNLKFKFNNKKNPAEKNKLPSISNISETINVNNPKLDFL